MIVRYIGMCVEKNNKYYQVLNAAREYYQTNLKALDNKRSIFLKEHGVSEESVAHFGIGYTGKVHDGLFRFMESKGISITILQELGLVSSHNGIVSDILQDRIIFPIHNEEGNVVSFVGWRVSKEGPVFKILRENPVYKKNEILCGLFESKDYIEKYGFVYLTEGIVDYIRLFQNGIENTITNNGSPLSDHQAERLASITNNAVILYDKDDCGRRLSAKDANKLDTFGIYVTYDGGVI